MRTILLLTTLLLSACQPVEIVAPNTDTQRSVVDDTVDTDLNTDTPPTTEEPTTPIFQAVCRYDRRVLEYADSNYQRSSVFAIGFRDDEAVYTELAALGFTSDHYITRKEFIMIFFPDDDTQAYNFANEETRFFFPTNRAVYDNMMDAIEDVCP